MGRKQGRLALGPGLKATSHHSERGLSCFLRSWHTLASGNLPISGKYPFHVEVPQAPAERYTHLIRKEKANYDGAARALPS